MQPSHPFYEKSPICPFCGRRGVHLVAPRIYECRREDCRGWNGVTLAKLYVGDDGVYLLPISISLEAQCLT